jgi:hypothetical protein
MGSITVLIRTSTTLIQAWFLVFKLRPIFQCRISPIETYCMIVKEWKYVVDYKGSRKKNRSKVKREMTILAGMEERPSQCSLTTRILNFADNKDFIWRKTPRVPDLHMPPLPHLPASARSCSRWSTNGMPDWRQKNFALTTTILFN